MGIINRTHVPYQCPRPSLHVRWLIRRDIPEVVEAEILTYGHEAWGEEQVHFHRCAKNRIGMVVEFEERILGFMFYNLHRSKLEILRLVVHPNFRNQGVGTAMVEKLKSKLCSTRRNRIVVRVPLDPEGCGWFRRRGFEGSWDGERGEVKFVFHTRGESS
jgi:ribosomal-protein-alanine N-acetyltransferase